MRGSRLIGRIDLAIVVSTSLQCPDVGIAHIGDQLKSSRVSSKEVLPNELAIFGLIGLVITVWSLVHQLDQCTVGVLGQQAVPLSTPDDLDHIPASATEEALKFLNNLSVATNRTIKSLQVGVYNKCEVVKIFVSGQLQSSAAFNFIQFSIA